MATTLVRSRPRRAAAVGGGVRAWTLLTALGALALGMWAFFFPNHFYVNFPIDGAHWVSTLGHYNEHLLRDYGSAQIGLGVAAVLVAALRSRDGIVAVMAGFVFFGTLHLGYHLTTFHHFSTASAAAQASVLTIFIVIPVLVLLAVRAQGSKEEIR